ncbi:ABC transporter ATP-binding protein [Sabulicella glaciei]|uniref:ABC transporter ATP-binding protein n=1 Tax=Sabulicella glaciei TaxID=2984948 RepID=A0ABT3NZ44_9PROT|nr:ABC transporter ATP-binding protein [Roseococcus sp. MDT2-1-1]MCW8087406.1 ABC transporter ATP-binding protein [Roseococcus sp. MDT2-1-1]
MSAAVEIRDLSVRFGDYLALDRASLSVRPGEVVALIGHSGCGKSTLLNAVAGLQAVVGGSVASGGRPVIGPGPDRAMVFQSHALLPWLSCRDNVLLALRPRFRGEARVRLRERADTALAKVGLSAAAERRPNEISGGMKQRVGIARALAIEPEVLLLDEPFGALDALTRGGLQDELSRIVEESGTTVLLVTHDVDEALLLADRIALMSTGPGARIAHVVPVPLQRPRDRRTLAEQPGYASLKHQLLDFLFGGQHAAA